MTAIWAAFDLSADPPDRGRRLRGRFTTQPQVLRADAPAEVPSVVAAAEAAALAGNWVLGGLTYLAAGAWDPAQRAVRDEAPAAHFEVYGEPPEPWPDEAVPVRRLDWRADASLAEGRTPEAAIDDVLDHIAAGDCYQVNLTSRWRTAAPGIDLFELFAGLVVGGHEKLPSDGHESARWRS